jgi:hypothetical protein
VTHTQRTQAARCGARLHRKAPHPTHGRHRVSCA